MYRFLSTFFALCVVCTGAYGADVDLASINVQPAKANQNLVPNGSFEQTDPNSVAKWWSWGTRWTADTTCTLDNTTAVSGWQSLKITNNTPLESPYTGLLTLTKAVQVEPGKPYTLSAWVKSNGTGVSSIVAGAGWRYRITLQPTGGVWQPFTMTFTPDDADKNNLGIFVQSESPTKGLWLDDFKLEQGEAATYDQVPNGTASVLQLWPESHDVELLTEGSFSVPFLLNVPKSINATLEANVSTSKKSITKKITLEPGMVQIMVAGTSKSAKYTPRIVTLRLLDGNKELASAKTIIRFHSQSYTKVGLQRLAQDLPGLKAKLEQLKSRGMDISYPMVTYTVLENFIGYAQEDTDKNEVKRASEALSDMDLMKRKLDNELSDALAGKRTFAAVPRWTGDTRSVIKSSSFIAPTVTTGKPGREMRPVFFTGYGHFAQVQADMEKWPNYGTNIIQIEIGPNSTLPEENRVNDEPARSMLKLLDRAQKSGVCVNLLISPHYVPGWVTKKIDSRPGSTGYNLRDPVSQDMLKRHISAIIPSIKDHPALHSICLANEPTYFGDKSELAVADWHAWLKDRHGDIKTLNSRWGTDYANFDDITLPYAEGKDDKNPMGRWLDCLRWNQEFLAGWYQMLADAVHEIAPNLPVHMKLQTPPLLGYADVQCGNDPYLVGRVNDIIGNDSVNWPSFGGGEFAQSWMTNARGEDLQRSVKDAPVFDSENHIIGDRDTRYIPGRIVRAALWQQAIHGQSATTIWVWERTFDRNHDFAASIMHRPECAEAVGIANYDMNRAANEITALQQAPAQVLILHDTSAMVYDGEPYDTCSKKAYMALDFCGVKIGFVTERQLEAGIVPSAPVVMVPYAKHLSDAAFKTLQAYKGRIVTLGGDDVLAYNEYDKKRLENLTSERITYTPSVTSEHDLQKLFLAKLSGWGIAPKIMLLDGKSNPVWGVEWKEADTASGTLVNLCNYLNEPISFRLSEKGKDVSAVDVLTGKVVRGTIKLQSLDVKLLKVKD